MKLLGYWRGKPGDNNKEASIYSDKGYTIIKTVFNNERVKIEYRNCEGANNSTSLQFVITTLEEGKRGKLISFSLPDQLSELFFERLKVKFDKDCKD